MAKKLNIAILYICTGKYTIFWKDFYKSCEKYFLKNHKKSYFVFTDSEHIDYDNKKEVKKIYQKKLGWPYDTLMRFDMFLSQKDELKKYDYLFFCNANILFEKEIKEDVLPDKYAHGGIMVTQHPGFYNKTNLEFTYDRNPASSACISQGEGLVYVMGGFNGGLSEEYLKLCEDLNKNIHDDLENNTIALWHDESHINRYIINRKYRILPCKYGYPEGWDIAEYKDDIKILIRNKADKKYGGHDYLRN